jgi:glycosyltransferase involved in cell wall biosynthesis
MQKPRKLIFSGPHRHARRHCWIADTPEAFAAEVVRLLADAELRRQLAESARSLLEQRFSWQAVGRQFEAVCCQRTIVRGRQPAKG